MKKIFFALIAASLIAACTPSEVLPLLPPSPIPPEENPATILQPPDQESGIDLSACIDPAPVQADIDRALAFPGTLFDAGDWERTYTVAPDKVMVSWYSASIPAVVNLEALIFPCGYEEPDLDYYFSVDSWAIIFGNYQGYQYVNECRNDSGLRLYNFFATDQGAVYQTRYWTMNDTPTRVITFMVVLPEASTAQMDEYAYAVFPQLQSCP